MELALDSTDHGEWRSLVAHPAGGRAVAGSNPVSPTGSTCKSHSSIEKCNGSRGVQMSARRPISPIEREPVYDATTPLAGMCVHPVPIAQSRSRSRVRPWGGLVGDDPRTRQGHDQQRVRAGCKSRSAALRSVVLASRANPATDDPSLKPADAARARRTSGGATAPLHRPAVGAGVWGAELQTAGLRRRRRLRHVLP